MTKTLDIEKLSEKSRRSDTKTIIAAILVVALATTSIASAYALTVTLDKGLGCGKKNWGIKNHQNDETGQNTFGMHDNCTTVLNQYKGRNNNVKIHTGISGGVVEDIAWQAIIQGTDPWGNSDTSGGALNHNTAFDNLASDQTTDYQLKTQWVWTNDKKPATTTSNIKANYLTNIWFDNGAGKVLVIDFMWDRLGNSNGNWVQETISDQDTGADAPGTQYYVPFCKSEGGEIVYHYNVVLDNTSKTVNVWTEKTANIESYIANAFAHSYNMQSGCSNSSPGTRGSYDIVDQETGIELQIFTAGHSGAVEGGYSFSELWY